MEAMRLALIGCGRVGQKHLQALVHLPEAHLVATVDNDRERAEAAAVAFDAEPFETAQAMLEGTRVDGVIVATPSGSHRALIDLAFDAGVDVLIEKPLTLSYAESRAVIIRAQEEQRTLSVTLYNRMLPGVKRVLEACRRGRLGEMVNGGVSVRWARPQGYYDEAPWRGTRDQDGGVLFNQAIHALDVLVEAMGRPDEVFAHLSTLTHRIEVEDTASATIRFANGALASVAVTTSVPKTNLEERITVVGSEGVAVLGPDPSKLEVWRVAGEEGEDEDEDDVIQSLRNLPPRAGWQGHFDALSDFVTSAQTRKPSALSAESSLLVLALAEALTRSGLEHRPVAIREITGE